MDGAKLVAISEDLLRQHGPGEGGQNGKQEEPEQEEVRTVRYS